MTPAEVDVAIAYYVGLFGRDVPDPFVPVWVEKLAPCEADDVREAIDYLAKDGFPPNVIQIRERALSEARYRDRQLALETSEAHALPPRREFQGYTNAGVELGEFLASDPEARTILEKIRHAVPVRDVPLTAEEREELGQLKPPKRAPVAMGLCPGVGKVGVMKDGVLCCPGCGDPVADGCGSSRYKRASEGAAAGS